MLAGLRSGVRGTLFSFILEGQVSLMWSPFGFTGSSLVGYVITYILIISTVAHLVKFILAPRPELVAESC